jgi:hypothetical protein
MPYYRFYFRTSEKHIAAANSDVDCADDEDANKTALKLLGGQTQYGIIEVWNASRMVSRHRR